MRTAVNSGFVSLHQPGRKVFSRCSWQMILAVAGVLWLAMSTPVMAQGAQQVINFSGIVVQGDSAHGVPGVNIYVPSAGRGTRTDPRGFFNMRTLVGDTVYITAVGFKTQRYVIPRTAEAALSVMIDLKVSSTMLPVVEILPYANEEAFKEAFVALSLPTERYENMDKNLAQERVTRMAMNMPMDGSLNYKNYMNQQFTTAYNRNFATTIPLLNPFAWAQFIKSVKNGDLKNKYKED